MSTLTVVATMSADPDLRYTGTGNSVCQFRVGERHSRKVNGEDEITWTNYSCEAWGSLGENIAASFTKGDRVILTGELRDNEYTAQDGSQRKSKVFKVAEAGPSLRWTTCVVEKNAKEGR